MDNRYFYTELVQGKHRKPSLIMLTKFSDLVLAVFKIMSLPKGTFFNKFVQQQKN